MRAPEKHNRTSYRRRSSAENDDNDGQPEWYNDKDFPQAVVRPKWSLETQTDNEWEGNVQLAALFMVLLPQIQIIRLFPTNPMQSTNQNFHLNGPNPRRITTLDGI